jgi:hypothetical protein
MPMPHPRFRLPSATSSITFSPSRPRVVTSDYCDAAVEMFALADTVGEIPKHSGDRILAPSGTF